MYELLTARTKAREAQMLAQEGDSAEATEPVKGKEKDKKHRKSTFLSPLLFPSSYSRRVTWTLSQAM